MAIRIRKVDGHVVALCAAETEEELGDLYLDDNVHHALASKFAVDWEMAEFAEPTLVKLMKREESKEKGK